MAMSNDTNILIELASENGGFITYTLCFEKLNMSRSRIDATIVRLYNIGLTCREWNCLDR